MKLKKPLKIKCRVCKKPLDYGNNEVFYGKRYGKSYKAYFHKECDIIVGTHENGYEPLGIPADRETRNARKVAHTVFDKLWKGGMMSRREAYASLKRRFGFEVHIGSADKDLCRAIISFCNDNHLTDRKK